MLLREAMFGLLWSAAVMRRIAAPMVDGMVSSTVLTMLVIPALYAMVKGWSLPQAEAVGASHLTAAPRAAQ